MSKPIVYYWAPSNGEGFSDGIALNQDADEDSELVLVTNTPGTPGVFSYSNILSLNPTTTKDVIRSINITSNDDNSGVTFAISGIGAPVDSDGNPTALIRPITEDLTGPNAETVASANIYTKITSILVTDADATNISVGYGATGITSYLYIDDNRTMGQMTGSFQFINQSNINATAYGSLNKPEYPNINGGLTPFGVDSLPDEVFIPAFVQRAATDADDLFSYNAEIPLAVVWTTITLTTPTDLLYDDSLYFTVIQQGIR